MKDKSKTYPWVGSGDADYIDYMQNEWGVPVHDDRKLFEMFILECFQAGLTWAAILKRRKAFRKAFSNWNIRKIAAYGSAEKASLMKNPGIIRNSRKIEAAVENARIALQVKKEFGSLEAYFWGFVKGKPVTRNKKKCRTWKSLPVESKESRAMAKDMRKRGLRFVGPVSCYAFMQAVGIVDDRIEEKTNE